MSVQLITTSRTHAVTMAATATSLVGLSVPVTGMLDGYPLLTGQAIRYALGGLCLFGWLRATGRKVPVPAKKLAH